MGNKDRGTKKWDAIMLPEHVRMIKEVFAESEYKQKPILDEQQIMEMNVTLQHAFENDLTTKIKYFADHDHHVIEGNILRINVMDGYLIMDDDDVTRIDFNDLLEVLV